MTPAEQAEVARVRAHVLAPLQVEYPHLRLDVDSIEGADDSSQSCVLVTLTAAATDVWVAVRERARKAGYGATQKSARTADVAGTFALHDTVVLSRLKKPPSVPTPGLVKRQLMYYGSMAAALACAFYWLVTMAPRTATLL